MGRFLIKIKLDDASKLIYWHHLVLFSRIVGNGKVPINLANMSKVIKSPIKACNHIISIP
ncbi:hypothetical protein [Clostridium folliculivorans]|uniref:hypothetical protein n=1 Tax=Clostridium folliculivorans TaxID=2886038 RepID=UPI0021C267CB|nr:hypothetical protein [Clostridium folliculivorans]